MTLTPIPGFKTFQTHHCISGSIRHTYEFHGYPISEDMLLGIGAGLGFIYWQMKGQLPMYGGRANHGRPGEEGFENQIGRITGVKVNANYTGSEKKAEQTLLQLLDAGQPVPIYVDMAYLPYLGLPEDYHFGGHMIAVAGYGDGQALVADRDGELHPITLDMLAKARGSKFKPFSPNNAWYTFDFSGKHAPAASELRQSIRQVVNGMLEPPITNVGVKGIRKAAQQTAKWPDIMEGEELRNACHNIYIFIDAAGGTGGGIFRYMYGRFLEEAAAIMNEPELANVGEELRVVGDRWQEVAAIMYQAYESPTPAALLPDAAARVREIADCEQNAWEHLRAVVGM